MNVHVEPGGARGGAAGVIKLAILAVGGQGGGVVTSWIVALAEANGYYVQSTSVPGVAQRTGATIYYVEMVPEGEATPILSLMPAAGDVDIVLAAELMEAGRAIQRGFVSAQTTLIASSHRAYAVAEKAAPGTGILDGAPILEAAEAASLRFLSADLERVAVANGSVISASLFGALAGSGALPFAKEAFEATIRASGKGVGPSLAAFAAGFEAVTASAPTPAMGEAGATTPAEAPEVTGPAALRSEWAALCARADELPSAARTMARRGLEKVVDYQDLLYGAEYLDRVEIFAALDRASGRTDGALTEAAAKAIANAMAYDDVIRVADLKVRASRDRRVRREVGVGVGALLNVTEYMHPRAEEICAVMPAGIGTYVLGHRWAYGIVERLFSNGRRVRTDRLRGFLPLYGLAALRPMRRRLLRHRAEVAHMEAWLATAQRVAASDHDLAVEILRCRRLVKGYSDTHARGLSKFDRVLSALPLLEGRADAAAWLSRLRAAALVDEAGEALDGALKTVATLDAPT
ncbi:indolepyruvate oxidoreductase subunit beta family protein [Acuticoccus mangrovi]|uniref:Indolepyruvate oxidoreductase subunit beta family protein n=1 Tax=Acuticoccus mangrovi TaxID=2796142 RepID=A0A934ITV2_9HYPH|nr:indolepyruvate oxidoreductase subunit beta family protein [Acuticoccus mangrovi]MBJ3777930.1 indolepyruvate oxidoreductase subunit beta family protein [Acuticoccus mangrovi]